MYSKIKLIMKTLTRQFIIVCLSTLPVSVAVAEIYQWHDSNGGIQFGNNPPENNSTISLAKSSIFRESRRTNLLYQGSQKSNESRIISVRLLKESKNSLIFDVNYYLAEKIHGSVNIGIIPDMDNWSSVYTKAHPGRHATTIAVSFSDSHKSVRSTSLKLTMALAKESGYVGSIFEHDLSFNKIWYKK